MESEKYNYINTFRWIYSRLQKHRKKQFWFLFTAMFCNSFLETIAVASVAFFASTVTDPSAVLTSKYIALTKHIVNITFPYSAKNLIIVSGLIMLLTIILKNFSKAIITYWTSRYAIGIEAYFGEKLLSGFLRLPYKWHLKCNTADLVNAVNWRTFLGRSFFQPCLKIINNILMVSIMLVVLFIAQPLISLISIVIIGSVAIFIYKVIKRKIDKAATSARDYQITINKDSTMSIHGIKDVKISLRENLFISKFLKHAEPLSRIVGVQNFYSQCPVMILETVGFSMIFSSIFIMLVYFDTSIAYLTGTMTIFAVTAWKVLPSINDVLGNIAIARNSLPYIANEIGYFNIIETNNKLASKNFAQYSRLNLYNRSYKINQTNLSFHFNKSIVFNNVNFYYDNNDRNVLYDICFEIQKGETIGIIGTSGSGKSTLVDLLIGLLEPTRGTILIDDKILTQDLLTQWLKIAGYVSQSPYIYDGTLAENVAFGMNHSDIDRKQVKKCCSMASMDDFIYDLPSDIDSFIGERGVKLSGGQQQRVAIARALYNQPEIIIFDEATSSLDTKSEKAIQKTIYSFKGKQTLIIVAHRLSTIKGCDKVIWLERGQISMIEKPEKVLKVYKEYQSFK